MSAMIDSLKRNQDLSDTKSYLIGLERGRIWAEDVADYFDRRRWSECEPEAELELPVDEEGHFTVLSRETPLARDAYLRGWLDGVKEIRKGF